MTCHNYKPGMYGASTVYDGQDAARAVAELRDAADLALGIQSASAGIER